MSSTWPLVPLGEVLTHRKEFVLIDDLQSYKRCRVQLHAQGIVLRDVVPGAEIKTKKQQVCGTGEFLVAEIDAKLGGYGIVPEKLAGAIVSSHYFLFVLNEERLDRRFLDCYIRTAAFRDQVKAQGSTNYAAIRPEDVLRYVTPLPPLAEQRRMVARIEVLAGRIDEAKELRQQANLEAIACNRSLADHAYKLGLLKCGSVLLKDVCETITDGDHNTPTFTERGVKFIFVGNVSSGRLHFSGSKFVAQDYFSSIKSSRKPKQGDILFTAVGATLGIPALVDTDEAFCFQRHIALLRPDQEKILPKYLWHMLRSSTLFRQAWSWITGTAQPTVSLRAIRQFPVPLLPLVEQKRLAAELDDLQTKLEQLSVLQGEVTGELDAILPAVLSQAFAANL